MYMVFHPTDLVQVTRFGTKVWASRAVTSRNGDLPNCIMVLGSTPEVEVCRVVTVGTWYYSLGFQTDWEVMRWLKKWGGKNKDLRNYELAIWKSRVRSGKGSVISRRTVGGQSSCSHHIPSVPSTQQAHLFFLLPMSTNQCQITSGSDNIPATTVHVSFQLLWECVGTSLIRYHAMGSGKLRHGKHNVLLELELMT